MRVFAAITLLFLLGCDSNPDERTRLVGPRLLAVQATPPLLSFNEGSSLDALTLDSDGEFVDVEVHYRACNPWQFTVDPERDCPRESSLELVDGQIALPELLDFYPPPPFGTPPAPAEDMTPCDEAAGFEVTVIAEAIIDNEVLVTRKALRVVQGDTIDRNPVFEAIEIETADDGSRLLRIPFEEASLDLTCRNDVEALEAVRVYLYSTSGSFDKSFTDMVPAEDNSIEAAEIRFTAELDGEEQSNALLWLVAVDNGGGVAWTGLSL